MIISYRDIILIFFKNLTLFQPCPEPDHSVPEIRMFMPGLLAMKWIFEE